MPDRADQEWEPDVYGDPDRPLRTTFRAFDALLGNLNAIAEAADRAREAGDKAALDAVPTLSGYPRAKYRTYEEGLADRAAKLAAIEEPDHD